MFCANDTGRPPCAIYHSSYRQTHGPSYNFDQSAIYLYTRQQLLRKTPRGDFLRYHPSCRRTFTVGSPYTRKIVTVPGDPLCYVYHSSHRWTFGASYNFHHNLLRFTLCAPTTSRCSSEQFCEAYFASQLKPKGENVFIYCTVQYCSACIVCCHRLVLLPREVPI